MITTRRLGYLAAGWAASYIPVHVYWALGGHSSPIGITGDEPAFRTANWGASLVIAGAGLTGLSLTQPWGAWLSAGLRRGAAWIGGVLGLAHWLVFTVASALRLVGVVGYPGDGDPSAEQLRHFDWANLGYFELWFGVMGVLLIACARRNRDVEPVHRHNRAPGASRLADALTLAGIATVVGGVFMFQPWVFAAGGPALLAAGVLVSIATNREGGLR